MEKNYNKPSFIITSLMKERNVGYDDFFLCKSNYNQIQIKLHPI